MIARRRQAARRRLALDERRARLLELGREVFSRAAYDTVSIDDIAAAAGISKGLLYHYFPSKRSFYVETVRHATEAMRAATEPDPALPPVARLLTSLDRYLAFVERNAALYAAVLWSGVGLDAEVNAIVEGYRATVAAWVARDLGIETPRPAVRAALRGWIGFVEGASLEWVASRALPREAVLRLIAESLRAALRAAVGIDPAAGLVIPDDR